MFVLNFGFNLRYFLLISVALSSVFVVSNVAAAQQSNPKPQSDKPDPFKAVRQFIGNWEGDSQGKPGVGKMEREYVFVLKDRFVRVSNKAVYPPQEKNAKGETHEDVGFIGYDRALKKLIFRQFHIEGFVVQYSLESISEDGRSFVFTSTAIENIPQGWRARESYRFLSNDEFVETFALAGPGKEFETYSETRFRRKQ